MSSHRSLLPQSEEEALRNELWTLFNPSMEVLAAAVGQSARYELPDGHLSDKVQITLANAVYIRQAELTPSLRGRLIRLAAFVNPVYADMQRLAAQELAKHETGMLSAGRAFGKTVLAAWLIAERKVSTLVLVNRNQLQSQWAERLSQFLGIPKKDIGRIGGGARKANGRLDIAVMQTFVRMDDAYLSAALKGYGQIIVDECHAISAPSFERIAHASTQRRWMPFPRSGMSYGCARPSSCRRRSRWRRRDGRVAHHPRHRIVSRRGIRRCEAGHAVPHASDFVARQACAVRGAASPPL